MSTHELTQLTYRQLLLWLERDAEKREDGELDMAVLIRVEADGELHVGALYDVQVGAGCDDGDALILDGLNLESEE